MASSFVVGGTTYPLLVTADGVPKKFAADISVRKMPGGSVTYIDIGGPTLRELSLSVLFLTGSAALAFEPAVGQVGTLTVFDGTYTALCRDMQRISRGVAVSGPTVLTVEFLLL